MSILEQIDSVRNSFLTDIESFPTNPAEIDAIRSKYIGRKGQVAQLFSQLGKASDEERPLLGQKLNQLKSDLSQLFDDRLKQVSINKQTSEDQKLDLSLPGRKNRIGSLHILEQTLEEIKEIYRSIGFHIAYGPEVDDDYHNFTALNIPEHHPARDMQDTFFINPETVLRTHTSNVQIHLMEEEDPPLKYIVPGRVYRNEAIGYKSYCLFHQVEGIYINEKVSFAELKGCLEYFVKQMFGPKKQMRFRPSYFPFTEPSAEVDILFGKKWLEILGCGVVNPKVLSNCKIDPKKFSGLAFGLGIERIAMLKYGVKDIREFYKSNLDFLRQFK